MIHLDTDPWELGKNYPAEVAILGDPKGTLPELTDAIRAAMPSGAQSAARDRLKVASEATKAELEKLRAQGAFARRRNAGAAARADQRDQRDPAQGCRGDRRDHLVGRSACASW